MIKIEHVVLASPEQMEFIIEGMRNPLNSWDRSDSDYVAIRDGTDHRKFMRMMPVYVRITAPLYWWKQADQYKVGMVTNSCSTIHKIHEKEFTMEDFSTEQLLGDEVDGWNHPGQSTYGMMWDIVDKLNECRELYLKTKDKKYWWQMIQLLPSSYNQTRNVMMNYEVLCNIYRSRKGHRLDEWREFCKWIETLPYSELITGNISRGMRQTAGILDNAIENYGKTDEANDIIDKICAIGNPNPVSVEDIKEYMKNVTMMGDD